MPIDIQEVVEDVSDLVSFPEVYQQISQIIDDPTANTSKIGALIRHDPNLTLRVLKLANSAFYGLSREVETVERAVGVLGTEQIKELVLTASAGKVLQGIPNELFVMDDFWEHSILCGLASQYLAAKSPRVDADFAFVGGLLHDIGQLVLFNKFPGESQVVLQLAMNAAENLRMYEAERKVFGFDHMELGGALLHAWRLPERLQVCAQYHHCPERAEKFPVEAAIVCIANELTRVYQLGDAVEEVVPRISDHCWSATGLSADDLAPAAVEAERQMSEVKGTLGL